jgi:hypothetical protein
MTTGYYWRITQDYINREPEDRKFNRVGTEGPGNPEADTSLPLSITFRLKDDDGQVYYGGKAANEESLELAFDFGIADAGCTALEVKVQPDGCWCCQKDHWGLAQDCYCRGNVKTSHWVLTLG